MIFALRGPRARRLLCAAALAGYGLLVVVPAARNPNTNGFAAYYTASRILLETPRDLRRVYDNPWFQGRIDAFGFDRVRDIHNIQPPTMGLMLAPIAWMSPARARVVWILCSLALWLGGLALLARSLALGGDVRGDPLFRLAALTTAYVPILDNLRQGQCYALLFFLLCAVFHFALHPNLRRVWLAGVPLGLLLVLKAAGF